MAFGYLNRNYDEQPEIPVGPNNFFSPDPADRGQPTHFYPRRQQFMFKVRVPADFGKQQLVWTLTRAGKTEKAVGNLDLEWEISQNVYSQNRRGLANDSVKAPPNLPPTISVDGAGEADGDGGHTARADGHRQRRRRAEATAGAAARRGGSGPRHAAARARFGNPRPCSSRSFSRAARGWPSPGRNGAAPAG